MVPRRLVRTKTSAAVVDYVLEELFEGRLSSGDRIDLERVCATLDVSRIPVREAMVILERDGIVSTKYHRGVYVEPFDAESIIDDFEIMGLLSGVAVRRLARQADPGDRRRPAAASSTTSGRRTRKTGNASSSWSSRSSPWSTGSADRGGSAPSCGPTRDSCRGLTA